jgi:N6-adenosine-specific RNA methylase IME4
MMLYKTILIDPPWPQPIMGSYNQHKNQRPDSLPYPTLTIPQIAALPIAHLSATAAHLWLWTTNRMLPHAFPLINAWGFHYMNCITWHKPSGFGPYWINTTQHLLFAYNHKCYFTRARYQPTCYPFNPQRHSAKPDASYDLIEAISDPPRLELFARRTRPGWDVWGNEVESDIAITLPA